MMGDLLLDQPEDTPEAGSMVRSTAATGGDSPAAEPAPHLAEPERSACCWPTTTPTCGS